MTICVKAIVDSDSVVSVCVVEALVLCRATVEVTDAVVYGVLWVVVVLWDVVMSVVVVEGVVG